MGGEGEIMCNQITFRFGREYHGNIKSMDLHLTKFRKLEIWKNKKLKFVNENNIYNS